MTIGERFWAKVQKTATCWLWTATRNPKGYGLFKIAGTCRPAPRVAWELLHGPIPDGFYVCHTCDNPPCVKPAHLFLGTPTDNARDRVAKGHHRTPRGDEHWSRRHPEWVQRGAAYYAARGMTGAI